MFYLYLPKGYFKWSLKLQCRQLDKLLCNSVISNCTYSTMTDFFSPPLQSKFKYICVSQLELRMKPQSEVSLGNINSWHLSQHPWQAQTVTICLESHLRRAAKNKAERSVWVFLFLQGSGGQMQLCP